MSCKENLFSLENGFKCFWRIGDFITCKNENGLILNSSVFYVDMLRESEWYIKIVIHSKNFDVYLRKNKGLFPNTNLHYSLYLLTNNGLKVIWKDAHNTFKSGDTGYGDSVQWDELYNDTLTMCLHMWNGATKDQTAQCVMTSKMTNGKDILHLPIQEFSYLTLSDFNNFPSLNFSKSAPKVEVSDKSVPANVENQDQNKFNVEIQYVILRTQTKEFSVPKALLCARSPVFNAMFDRDMKENESNTVDIEDIDSETLSLFLRYLHLEPLGHLEWDSAYKLFYTADKFQIMQLKTECVSSLRKELTEENVCDALVLADMHQEKELKQSALEFFCKNSKSIISSDQWKSLTLSRTELATEALSKMADKLLSLLGKK